MARTSTRKRRNTSQEETPTSRRSSRSRRITKDEEEDDDDDDEVGIPMSMENTLDVEEDEDDEDNESEEGRSSPPQTQFSQAFSQVETIELTQTLPATRNTDHAKFSNLDQHTREKALTNLSRVLLFKALSGAQTIDRLKCIDEALDDPESSLHELCRGLGNVLFQLATDRLKNVFGFDVRPPPMFFQDMLSTNKWKDRYYVVNSIRDEDGLHARSLHDNDKSMEKGLLMVILAFCYCKGDPSTNSSRNTGYVARWITDQQLYRLLHCLDSNIPEEPPVKKSSSSRTRRSHGNLDVDASIKKFVDLDYLLMEKVVTDNNNQLQELPLVRYSLGPRAALEIGRRQVIHFCAEILDEEPDPTMLAEIDDAADEEEEEEEEQE